MEESQATDELLVRRAKQGDLTAFDQLVKRHYQRIYALAFQMLGDAEDAADATQETFVKAFERLGSFRGKATFFTWLYRIAINTCKDWLRRPRPLPFSQLEEPEDPSEPTLPLPAEPNPGEIWRQREQAELVWWVLRQLPEEAKTILVLCDMQGLSYSEVAEVLGIPEGTVKSRLHRARQAFKEIWVQLEKEQISPPQRPKGGDER